MQVLVLEHGARVVVKVYGCRGQVVIIVIICFQLVIVRRGLRGLFIKVGWVVAYCLIDSILVGCRSHPIWVMLIHYIGGNDLRLLLNHVIEALIVMIVWWKVLRILIIGLNWLVHLFLEIIIGWRIHLLFYRWKSSSVTGWWSSRRLLLLLQSGVLPMMRLSREIWLWAFVPMYISNIA